MFHVKECRLQGCLEITPKRFEDKRGNFIKVFHDNFYKSLGIEAEFKEEFFSYSHQNVIRGLHFQSPPYDHAKLVYCIYGEIDDVIIDLRLGSPTFGITQNFNLNSSNNKIIYIPKGFAHGFLAKTEGAIVMYKVETVHNPNFDNGILWSSIGYNWGINDPIVSARDSKFQNLNDFKSPFIFKNENESN